MLLGSPVQERGLVDFSTTRGSLLRYQKRNSWIWYTRPTSFSLMELREILFSFAKGICFKNGYLFNQCLPNTSLEISIFLLGEEIIRANGVVYFPVWFLGETAQRISALLQF